MKLYSYFRSSAAFRVRIALNLKGLAYEQAFVHILHKEHQRPEYLAINPQGIVPALEEDGQIFRQSLAIIEYLDETHPHPPLLPGHPADRARVRGLALAVACEIHPLANPRVLRRLTHEMGQGPAAIEAWCVHWITLGFEAIERMLVEDGQTGSFCHGDEPGLADVFLVPQYFNTKRYPSFDMTPFPTIGRIVETCLKLDAFDRARPEKQPDAE